PFSPLMVTSRSVRPEPSLPVAPPLPEAADGSEMAVDEAAPVSPVLVAEDWAVEAPELPEVARGSMVARMAPPSPPLATALARESPPLTRMGPVVTVPLPLIVTCASPPGPERAPTEPPLPPAPAVALANTTFVAFPVSPEVALTVEEAPELAEETAPPLAETSPVGPESPVSPERATVAAAAPLRGEAVGLAPAPSAALSVLRTPGTSPSSTMTAVPRAGPE